MSKQLFIVTDLGGGDGGKGGVVHALCSSHGAHTVVKVGGAQGSHGVRTASGKSFNFSHFGCGTFSGSRTHISRNMVIDPGALVYEGELLQYEHGVANVFGLMTVDCNALCVTPFHRIASRLHELARKDRPKGTIGVGVGEAVLDAERYPELAIRAGEINRSDFRDKLEAIRRNKLEELAEIIDNINDLWSADQPVAEDLAETLRDADVVEITMGAWEDMCRKVSVVPADYLASTVLSHDGTVVVESSHGVLTDRYSGFHPHTTRLRVLPEATLKMVAEAGYDGEVVKLGVTRAYQIRHGAGPMVTESPYLAEKLLPGSSKETNRWQGKVRVGPLDTVALRYAINVCGGPKEFDALAVTWFDQISAFGYWPVCCRYIGATDLNFFTPSGEIKVRRGTDEVQLSYQEKLGELLGRCRPNITDFRLRDGDRRQNLFCLCAAVLNEELDVPVRMVSFGPTEDGKMFK